MPQSDDFRKISSFDLRPVFISLGLPQASFKQAAQTRRSALFDAALNADPSCPDNVWLFKGSDYFVFNLRTRLFESEAKQIAGNWGGSSWPVIYASGIDAAVWGGPAFPNFWYFFKGDSYLRLNSSRGGQTWLVDEGPQPLVNAWGSARDTWFKNGCDAALHGLGTKHQAKLHLFKGNEYMRHNLLDGRCDIGPKQIREIWQLPEPFSNKIDMAFYGTGEEEEMIYFFSGTQCALYDTKSDETVGVFPIEERYPVFARFMKRPQLFLVEDYRLETYVGPPQLGRLIETRTVMPGAESKTLMVTETTDSSHTTLQRSLLESQDASAVNNFNQQLDTRSQQDTGSDTYRYHLNANMHGDASANSVWGGEVNASANVQGGTDSVRSNFADSTFSAIGSQVTEATKQINQRTYNSTEEIEHKERVLKQDEIILKNPSDQMRQFEFYEQLQPYVTLLVLKNVRIAYADGTGIQNIAPIAKMAELVVGKFANEEAESKLSQFIANDLSAVKDQDGQSHSLFQDGSASSAAPTIIPNPTSTYMVRHANGDTQQIVTQGLVIKAVKDWLTPTLTMIAVEKRA